MYNHVLGGSVEIYGGAEYNQVFGLQTEINDVYEDVALEVQCSTEDSVDVSWFQLPLLPL